MRSRQNLIKEADRLFSLHIRNRGATFGYNHCFTCGVYLPVEHLQAGHFIPRRFIKVRWHPVNVWPQCHHCNVELSGNLLVYENKLIIQFSKDAVDGLWYLARHGNDVTNDEIVTVINMYKP